MRAASNAGMPRVIAAEVVSNFGSMMSRLAIPWLAVLSLAATPWQMALLAVADVLAGALTALALGIAVDRLPRRATMIAADLARATLLGALALAAVGGRLTFGALLAVAAAGGALTVGFELARSAWIAQAARPAELSRANAQLAAGGAISEALAFAVTGAVFQWIGSVAALVADAASYLASAWLLRGVREPRRAAIAAAAAHLTVPATTLTAAIALIAQQPVLRTLALLEVLVAAATGVAGTSYMIYVSRDLALPTAALGLVFALGGVGSALGAALAPRAGRRLGSGRALAIGLATAAGAAALIPLASGAGVFAFGPLAVHQLLGDGGLLLYAVHDRTLRQALAPADALARIDGAMRTLGLSATVAGALGGATFATAYGTRPALWLCAGLLGAAAALALASWRRGAVSARSSIA